MIEIFRKYGMGVENPSTGRECEVFRVTAVDQVNDALWTGRVEFFETITSAREAENEGDVTITFAIDAHSKAEMIDKLFNGQHLGHDLSNAEVIK